MMHWLKFGSFLEQTLIDAAKWKFFTLDIIIHTSQLAINNIN